MKKYTNEELTENIINMLKEKTKKEKSLPDKAGKLKISIFLQDFVLKNRTAPVIR